MTTTDTITTKKLGTPNYLRSIEEAEELADEIIEAAKGTFYCGILPEASDIRATRNNLIESALHEDWKTVERYADSVEADLPGIEAKVCKLEAEASQMEACGFDHKSTDLQIRSWKRTYRASEFEAVCYRLLAARLL